MVKSSLILHRLKILLHVPPQAPILTEQSIPNITLIPHCLCRDRTVLVVLWNLPITHKFIIDYYNIYGARSNPFHHHSLTFHHNLLITHHHHRCHLPTPNHHNLPTTTTTTSRRPITTISPPPPPPSDDQSPQSPQEQENDHTGLRSWFRNHSSSIPINMVRFFNIFFLKTRYPIQESTNLFLC